MPRRVDPPILIEVPPDVEKGLRELLEGMRQTIDLREGRLGKGTNSRFVTIQDLIDAGVIAEGDIT